MFDKGPKDNPENIHKAEGFQLLLNAQLERLRQTASLEWKINFSIWTLLTIFCFLSAKCRVNFLACPFNGALFVLSVVALHWYWLTLVQRSKGLDFDRALLYRRACEDALGMSERQKTDPSSRIKDNRARSWAAAPVAVTLILLMALFTVSVTRCSEKPYHAGSPAWGMCKKGMRPGGGPCPLFSKTGLKAHCALKGSVDGAGSDETTGTGDGPLMPEKI